MRNTVPVVWFGVPVTMTGMTGHDPGISGHVRPESLVTLLRNTQLSFVLRIGEASDLLRTCHSNSGVDCSAFVTACNPLGKKLPAQENALRHIALLAEIKKRSLFFLPGKSKHPTSKRAVEKSVLVLGLSLEATKVLGRRFEQNAVVWTGSDGVPFLVPLD